MFNHKEKKLPSQISNAITDILKKWRKKTRTADVNAIQYIEEKQMQFAHRKPTKIDQN